MTYANDAATTTSVAAAPANAATSPAMISSGIKSLVKSFTGRLTSHYCTQLSLLMCARSEIAEMLFKYTSTIARMFTAIKFAAFAPSSLQQDSQ